MTTDLPGLARKLEATGDALAGQALKRALSKGGKKGKDAALDEARRVAGQDRAIIMGGRRKAVLGAGYDVETSSVAINLRPPGLWVLFDSGAKEHQIPGKRKRNAKILLLADGSYATTVVHPGRGGVGAIRHAAADIRKDVPPVIGREIIYEVGRAWR